MKKILYIGGPSWMFLTPEQMYGEDGKLRSAHRHYTEADIYFLSKMRKVRFDPRKTGVSSDGEMKVSVCLGDPNGVHDILNFKFPHVYVLYSMRYIKQQFQSLEHFYRFALYKHYLPKRGHLRALYGIGKRLASSSVLSSIGWKLMKWTYSKEVKFSHDNAYEISVEDPLLESIVNDEKVQQLKASQPDVYNRIRQLHDADWHSQRLETVDYNKLPGKKQGKKASRLTVDQVVNLFDIDVGAQEVLYIGKTNREPFERLLPHEKVQELESRFLRNDGEAIVVHLFGFQKIDLKGINHQKTKLKKEKATTACEAELINYFKPVMNTDYVKDVGRSTWKHMKEMRSSGYDQISLELDIDGQYCRFFTDNAGCSGQNRHVFNVDLKTFSRQLM